MGLFNSLYTYVLIYCCHYRNIWGLVCHIPYRQIQRNQFVDQLENLYLHTFYYREYYERNLALQIREQRL